MITGRHSQADVLKGSGNFSHALRVPVTEGCQRRRECRGGEGHIHQKCGRQLTHGALPIDVHEHQVVLRRGPDASHMVTSIGTLAGF
jgi:hypothetical protein